MWWTPFCQGRADAVALGTLLHFKLADVSSVKGALDEARSASQINQAVRSDRSIIYVRDRWHLESCGE